MKFAGGLVFILFGLAFCENQDDTSTAFMEAAKALFENKQAIDGLQGVASAFMQSDSGDKPGDLQNLIMGLGSLMAGQGGGGGKDGGGGGGLDLSVVGSIISGLSSLNSAASNTHSKRSIDDGHGHGHESSAPASQGFDFDSLLGVASSFLSQSGNAEGVMGLLPLVLDTFSGGGAAKTGNPHDHSDHAWFMPPVLEKLHLMWDHFRNSELGQTLWKNSGLANIVGSMSDETGRIQWEKIMESFENPPLRRRWISSLTNFVAEWISHVSDPATQQRYLATAQFIGNSFLKSQGYPKSVMFDPARPTESLSRLANAVAQRHLNMKIDSYQYVKPAVAYVQELTSLASEKGFIMSRINARELSRKLSDSINNGFVAPLLKAYRAYKWGSKIPQCAAQILCTINQNSDSDAKATNESFRVGLTKVASFPAAWAISNKSGLSFWSLYAAILEKDNCQVRYPADCTVFHDEEIRVTTIEYEHNEL
ncbi:hypothetical protein QAD02_022551 [Eretmocerus hayati]|uniref:Uncharacterized protein n=1 Tax=Eretmocerus hayati TaxID=131215 RepID=A0ACC2PWM6_9HYME|nr:hypothetical protein QAD02_022551 [Eretmocerus hayati]